MCVCFMGIKQMSDPLRGPVRSDLLCPFSWRRMMVMMMVTVFLKTHTRKHTHTLLWSRGVIPARCTVRVSARRCLTSNAIFRRKYRLIALSDCVGDEWRRAVWEGGRADGVLGGGGGGDARASQTRQRARGQWQRRARVCISGGGELLRVYFRVRCVFVCRLNG